MSVFEIIILLVVEFVCGAAGGLAIGRWAGGPSFGKATHGIMGGIGGLLLTWIAARVPGVGHFVGRIEGAADATMRSVGGLTPAILVGGGMAGLLGGIALTALAGLVRRGTAR